MSNSYLSDAAAIAGEGLNRGLTKEEVVDLLDAGAENKRAALRGRIDERRAGRAQREGNREAAEAFLAEDARKFRAVGRYADESEYPDPMGEAPIKNRDEYGRVTSVSRPQDLEIAEYVDREAERAGKLQQRGGPVLINRGQGFERMWREHDGQIVGDQKFAKNKSPDMADPFVKPVAAPAAAIARSMGGPNGLATQLIDKVNRGELDPNTPLPVINQPMKADGKTPMTGGKIRTVQDLIDEMVMEADPSLKLEKDIAEAAKVRRGPSTADIKQRAAIEARLLAEAQGGAARRTRTDRNVGFSSELVNAIRQDAIQKNIKRKGITPIGSTATFDEDLAIELAPVIEERMRRAAVANPAAIARNNALAEMEAIGYIGNGNDLGRIQNIQSLGLASKKFNRGVPMDQFNVVQGVDPRTFEQATQMIGPDGSVVGFADNNDRFIADVNMSGPDNLMNAPLPRSAEWLEANLPDAGRAGGTNFGWPGVRIGDELTLLNQRLGGFAPEGGIRSLNDLEIAVDAVIQDAGGVLPNFDAVNKRTVMVSDPYIDEVLYKLGYTQDDKLRLANSMMQLEAAMKSPVNAGQKELFARGLDPTYANLVARNFEGNVQLARIGQGEKVGVGKNRQGVGAGLRGLKADPKKIFEGRDQSEIYATVDGATRRDGSKGPKRQVMLPNAQRELQAAQEGLEDARKPFIGAPAGQEPERAKFLRGKGVNMSPSQRERAWGGDNAERANEVERRAKEDAVLRAQEAESAKNDPRAALMRQKNAEFEAAGVERAAADNDREKFRALEMMGMPLEGRGQMILGGQIVEPMASADDPEAIKRAKDAGAREVWRDRPERNLISDAVFNNPALVKSGQAERDVLGQPVPERFAEKINSVIEEFGGSSFVSPQKATSAVVNTPTDSAPLQARGGWMSGGNKGAIVNPWSSPEAGPEQGPYRPLSTELKNELAALNSGYVEQGPRPKQNFSDPGIKADGPESYRTNVRSEADYRQSVRNLGRIRKIGRNAAIAGGATAGVAGLDGVINGERKKREEEAAR